MTTSFACAPLGMTTFPLEVTSCATVATTPSPTLAFFELMDWSIVTVMAVPAGTEFAACVKVVMPRKSATRDTEKRLLEFISVTSR